MNIFVTDPDPTRSAQCLPDKHVVKMPLETCQMLADLYTKNVNAVIFERLANLLTGRSKMSEVRAFFAKFVR